MQERLFGHEQIMRQTPGSENDVCLLSDLTGNGWLDVIVGGKYGRDNLCWYEAPNWRRHVMGEAYLEAGGVLIDVNGNGRLDCVVGEAHSNGAPQVGGGCHLYWFEQPDDPRSRWVRHVIEDGLHRFHSQAVGDVDGDGRDEIVIVSQEGGVVAYYDLPKALDGRRWPYGSRHIIYAEGSLEGVAVCDWDGDGANEIIAGTLVFSRPQDGRGFWPYRRLAEMDRPAIAVGDLTGDERPNLVAAEGESYPARLAWYGADGEQHLLDDDLFHPHSLGLADFSGDGRLDIFCGEMGLGQWQDPRLIIWHNLGGGAFEPVIVSRGVPTHEAKVGDVNGNGKPDIVGKPYKPGNWVDVWWNTW